MITSLTTLFAYLLFWLGMIVWFVGDLMFLAVVFRSSTAWFLGCLFVPFVDWVYFAFNVKRTLKPVLVASAGFLMTCLSFWLWSFNIPG